MSGVFFLPDLSFLFVKFDTMGQIWKEFVKVLEILFSAEPECHVLFYIDMLWKCNCN